jgi:hypothetical protein
VFTAAGAEAEVQPTTFAAVIVPVMTGATLSVIVIVWFAVEVLLQASFTVYVRVMVIGQVPTGAPSELVTTRLASAVQLSEIAKPIPSNAATVFTAAGAEAEVQPTTFAAVIVPVMTGTVLSKVLVIFCVHVLVQPFKVAV